MKQWIFVILALAIAGAAGLWVFEARQDRRDVATATGLLPEPSSSVGGKFALTDQNGKAVTQADYTGKYLLIYFGYTFCPDACPTELLVTGQALDEVEKVDKAQADKVQPLFITIDPARDTRQKLAEYVPSFHPRLVGLTGTDAQIAQVAREYKVYYAKGDTLQGTSDYAMDHSSYVYLVAPDGRTIGIFSSDTTAEDMAKALETAVK